MEIRTNFACVLFLLGSIVALGQTANVDQGRLVGIAYINRFFGLTFTRPSTLNYEATQSAMHPQDRAFVLTSARGKDQPGHVTSMMVLSADRLSYYPPTQQSATAYLSKMEQDEKKDGYVLLQHQEEFVLGDSKWLRVDLQKGPLRESLLVTIRRGFALVLIALSESEQDLDSMLHSAKLKFDN
jgi:hypothetical protein